MGVSYKKYRIFHFMWCFFILNHHLITVKLWTRIGNGFLNPSHMFFLLCGVLTAIFVIISFFKPNNPKWFVATLIFWSLLKLDNLPTIPNHIILALIVNLTIIFGFLFVRTNKKGKEKLGTLYDYIAPYLRWDLIIVYFFTVFHKLNWAYFNTDVSCSVELYDSVKSVIPFIPKNEFIEWSLIIGVLVIETLIPIFLLIARTRVLGIILGLVFHLLLSLHPNIFILSFTFEVYAMLALFLPNSSIEQLETSCRGLYAKFIKQSMLNRALIIGFLLLLGLMILFNGIYSTPSKFQSILFENYKYFWLVCFTFLILFILISCRGKSICINTGSMMMHKNALLIFTFLIVLNGLTPYLGIKTATTFSMFSNLKIFGKENNHILVKNNIPLIDYSSDYIEILEAKDEMLTSIKNSRENMVYFEFQRWIHNQNESDSISVVYKHNDSILTLILPQDRHLPKYNTVSWLEKKLLMFKNLPKEDPCHCQW